MGIGWNREKNISKEEYEEFFKGSSSADDEKIKKAYEQAARTREFEIGLYWKRAGYFWAFIVSIYTAFFSVQKEFFFTKDEGLEHGALALLVLSAIGFFFCVAWLLSNYASKHWQENWENHMDLLEDFVTGPLYKIYSAGKSFSVSKINIAAGWVVSACSFLLFLFETVEFCIRLRSLPRPHTFIALVVLSLCVFALFWFYTKGNGEDSGEIEFDRKVYDGIGHEK